MDDSNFFMFSQQKIDFRTAEEQAKDPNIALKKSLDFSTVQDNYIMIKKSKDIH